MRRLTAAYMGNWVGRIAFRNHCLTGWWCNWGWLNDNFFNWLLYHCFSWYLTDDFDFFLWGNIFYERLIFSWEPSWSNWTIWFYLCGWSHHIRRRSYWHKICLTRLGLWGWHYYSFGCLSRLFCTWCNSISLNFFNRSWFDLNYLWDRWRDIFYFRWL